MAARRTSAQAPSIHPQKQCRLPLQRDPPAPGNMNESHDNKYVCKYLQNIWKIPVISRVFTETWSPELNINSSRRWYDGVSAPDRRPRDGRGQVGANEVLVECLGPARSAAPLRLAPQVL